MTKKEIKKLTKGDRVEYNGKTYTFHSWRQPIITHGDYVKVTIERKGEKITVKSDDISEHFEGSFFAI